MKTDVPQYSYQMMKTKTKVEIDAQDESFKKVESENKKKQEDIDKCRILGCSYLYCGNNPVEQKCYYCLECDPFRVKCMCTFCYFICHQNCYYNLLKCSEEEPFSFVCACGQDFDHITKKKNEKRNDGLSKCNMRENFDLIFMEGQEACKCGEHGNITICSICYFECHAYCSNRMPPQDSNPDSCECAHSNHSQYKHYAPTSSIQLFMTTALKKFLSLQPSQFLNLLFSPHQFPIDDPKNLEAQRSKTLLTINLFSETFRQNFKTYYFAETITKEMFSLNQLIKLCRELKDVKGQQNQEKLHLFNLFFFIHLKNDFKLIKSYTTADFLFHSVFERLEHRKYMFSNNVYTHDFLSKYSSCKEFFFKHIFNYITENVEHTTIHFGDEWTKSYEDFLKIICFMLKRMFFEKEELKIIINQLEPFYQKVFSFLDYPKKLEQRIPLAWSLVFQFVKLFLLIAVNYNDFAFMNYIEQSRNTTTTVQLTPNTIYFIHSTESGIGKKLFQMIIQNCQLLSIYYKYPDAEYEEELNRVNHKYKSISKKISSFRKKMKYCLNLSSETLKLFSVVDNSYYNQIIETNENDLKSYIKSTENLLSQSNSISTIEGFQTVKEMKFRIESFFQFFFTSTKVNDYFIKDQVTEKKVINWVAIISQLKISEMRSTIYQILTEKPGIECDKLSMVSFYKKVKLSKKVSAFIDELIVTNFDETISKLLVYFDTLLTEKSGLNYILSLLLLYCLNRRGIKYFQTGKTLSRIRRVFKLYYKQSEREKNEEKDSDETQEQGQGIKSSCEKEIELILQFLRVFVKSLKIQDVYLYKNKNLTKITNSLIKYLKSFNAFNSTNWCITITGKKNIALVFSIFSYLSSNYCFEDFDHIKLTALKLCSNLNIFTSDSNNEVIVCYKKKLQTENILLPRDTTQTVTPLINFKYPFSCCGTSQSNDPQVLEAEATKKIYYTICQLISQNTYCYYKHEEKFFDFLASSVLRDFFEEALRSDTICFKHRRLLLRFIRTIYFIERINPIDYDRRERYFTCQDYEKYVYFLDKYPEHNRFQESLPLITRKEECIPTEEYFRLLQNKKIIAEKIIDLLSIFQKEIDTFHSKRFQGMQYAAAYIREIVLSIQFFSDFLNLEESLCNFLMPPFHDLIESFIFNSHFIIGEYLSIMKINKFEENEYIHKIYKQKWIEQKTQSKKHTAFNIISECLSKIYKITDINKSFCLSHFTKIYDKTVEMDFSSFALVPFKDYEYFYEDNDQKEVENFHYFLRKDYESQFNNVDQTNFLSVLGSNSKEFQKHDYQQFFINYFVAYFQSKKSLQHLCHYECLIYIITKMLYYDTNISRRKLNALTNKEVSVLTEKLKNIIRENIVHALSLAKNNFIHTKLLRMTNLTKLIFEFLQLLISTQFERRIFNLPYEVQSKEDYFEENKITFTTYHKPMSVKKIEQIFYETMSKGNNVVAPNNENNNMNNSNSIFDIIHSTIKCAYFLIDLPNQVIYEMPFDELIVLLTNVITTFMVYIESTDNDIQNKIFSSMEDFYYSGMFHCIYIRSARSESNAMRKKELLYVKLQILNILISYFQGGKDDRRKKEMVQKMLKYFSPDQLYEEIYLNFIDLLEDYPIIQNPHETSITDRKFVDELEIQYAFDDDFREALQLKACFKLFTITKILEDDYLIFTLKRKYSNPKANRDTKEEDVKFKLYQFLSEMVIKVDIKKSVSDNDEDPTENQCQVAYFIRPYLTLYLSHQTKWDFIEQVDRKSATAKLNALISASDQFMLEMVYNSKHLKKKKWRYKIFTKLNMYYFHLINYLFTIIHNILLIEFYYRDPSLDQKAYEAAVTPDKYPHRNYWVGVAQAVFILSFFALSYLIAPLSIYHQIMKTYHYNFLLRKKADKGKTVVPITIRSYFKDTSRLPRTNLTWLQSTRVTLTGILTQGNVSIFLLTVILLVVFFATRHPIWIVIPVAFVMSVSDTLYNILLAVKLRWWQLLTLLLFTYMCIYIFVWLGMFYFGELFSLQTSDVNSGEQLNETFCSSTIQCLLLMIEVGMAGGGGIGDNMAKVSYRLNINYFIKRFFYVMLFHIIIILVLCNVFLGIIVDTFADLRDNQQRKEDDMTNKCFICQITRDQSLMTNINFDVHCQETHNMWNYIYFLTYLHIGNPHEFSSLEEYVWEKLGNQDITWIPIEKSSDEK